MEELVASKGYMQLKQPLMWVRLPPYVPAARRILKKEDTTQEATVSIAGLLSDAGPIITTGMDTVWDLVTANPLLTFFVGCSILSVGFRFFRKAKRAV